MRTGVWVSMGVLFAGFLACSNDDESGSLEGIGGEAGATMDSEGGRATGGSNSNEPGGRGGSAAPEGGAPPAQGGKPAAGAGAAGAPNEAGGGGASGGSADAGAGGAIAYPTGPYVVCPDLGDEFAVRHGDLHTEQELALAKAFHCDVGGDELGDFTIERFEVEQTTFEVIASPHRFENYDRFTVVEDCGPRGYIEPVPAGEYESLYAEILEPGIYTRLSCAVDLYLSEEPPPPAPTNVDCEHAKPLPKSPAAALDEARIADDLPRFYSFTIPFDQDFPDEVHQVTIHTGYSIEGASGADVSLHGVSNDRESSSSIPFLDGENAASFSNVEPGTYCVELKVDQGVKYSVYYATSLL